MAANLEHELLAVVRAWDRAMVQNDPEAIGRFMADDWTIIGSDGTISDKAAFLGLIRSGMLSHEVMFSDDITVRMYGGAAVITARGVSSGVYQGHPFREVERKVQRVHSSGFTVAMCFDAPLTTCKT